MHLPALEYFAVRLCACLVYTVHRWLQSLRLLVEVALRTPSFLRDFRMRVLVQNRRAAGSQGSACCSVSRLPPPLVTE